MSWAAELEAIETELHDEIYNKGTDANVTFISYNKIQKVWAGDRLDRFLRDPRCDPDHGTAQAISNLQIEEARRGLLRMISLLIGISWSGWARFKKIFFLNPMAATQRRDNNIENLEYDDLKHDSFLGNTPFIERFRQDRWIYIPITLIGGGEHDYKYGRRLPLVRQKCSRREGAFGEVTKEKILPGHIVLKHSSHHLGLPDQTNSAELTVARKRFPNGQFHVERRQLKFIQSSLSSHKRIVYPLATVIIGTDLNIIMPWADMDLEDYLLGEYRSMSSDIPLLESLLKESGELAAALEFLHRGLQAECEWPDLSPQGICHADFRPRNILVFRKNNSSTGTWAITDFGVSHRSLGILSSDRNESGLSITRHSVPQPRGGIYQAPDPHARRRSDIWSFGCILVQIFSLGLELRYQFQLGALQEGPLNWKPFGDRFCGEEPPALNQNVGAWIAELPKRYHGLYDDMFLAEMQSLLSWMLQIDLEMRPRATDVRRCLHRLYKVATGRILESVDSSSITSSPTTATRPSISSLFPTITPDPPVYGLTVGALVSSIKSGSVDDINECLRHRPDVEGHHENDRPLIHAIERKEDPMLRAPIISALLLHNPDLDVITRSFAEETPLNLAVFQGDVDTVRVLIGVLIKKECQSALNELSRDRKTPLMEAASRNHVAVVTALLDGGADTTICMGEYQHNCLHFAVLSIKSEEDLLKAFLGREIDFNLSPSGIEGYETPMMQHIKLGVNEEYGERVNTKWERKFNVLCDGGGDVNMTYPQKSPLQLAIEKDKVDIVRILLNADAILPPRENGTSSQMRRLITQIRRDRRAA